MFDHLNIIQGTALAHLPIDTDGKVLLNKLNEYRQNPIFCTVRQDLGAEYAYTIDIDPTTPPFTASLVSSNPAVPKLTFLLGDIVRGEFTGSDSEGKAHLYQVTIHGRLKDFELPHSSSAGLYRA